MEAFLYFIEQVVVGPYSYVLIGEITAVTVLLIVGIWLIVRRMQRASMFAEGFDQFPAHDPEPRFTTLSEEVEKNSPAQPRQDEKKEKVDSGQDLKQIEELKDKVAALSEKLIAAETENERLNESLEDGHAVEADKLRRENQGLAKKISGLEGKLLEFEIIKEEIGMISTLKAEITELKRLYGVPTGGSQHSEPVASVSGPKEPTQFASTPSASSPPDVKEPQISDGSSDDVSSEGGAMDRLSEAGESEPMATSAEPAPASEPVEAVPEKKEMSPKQLDDLLDQIDDLAKDASKSN